FDRRVCLFFLFTSRFGVSFRYVIEFSSDAPRLTDLPFSFALSSRVFLSHRQYPFFQQRDQGAPGRIPSVCARRVFFPPSCRRKRAFLQTEHSSYRTVRRARSV